MEVGWAHHFLVVVLHPPQPSIAWVDSAQEECDHVEARKEKTVGEAGCAANILWGEEEALWGGPWEDQWPPDQEASGRLRHLPQAAHVIDTHTNKRNRQTCNHLTSYPASHLHPIQLYISVIIRKYISEVSLLEETRWWTSKPSCSASSCSPLRETDQQHITHIHPSMVARVLCWETLWE